MSCSCRLSAWRIFARSLAQVHSLEPASRQAHQRVLTLPLRPIRATNLQSLHTSRSWRQDAPAEKPVQQVDAQEKQPSSSSISNSEEGRAVDSNSNSTNSNPTNETESSIPEANRAGNRIRRGNQSTKQRHDTSQSSPSGKQNKKGARQPSSSSPPMANQEPDLPRPKREKWQIQKESLKEKFPEGWRPRKRLSPDALAGIRALNAQFPEVYTTKALADKFEVSAEAIRRILKSKWKPTVDEEQDRQERWFRRGKQVWERKAAFGIKPPERWRREGVARDPGYHGWKERSKKKDQDWEDEEITKYRQILEERKAREGGRGGRR
ncbi:Required for respiratory growth protein 9 mitochondrial [Lecanicillium sp. MT-2017a]|nr:Required for respiratory growth protein 9 mitochondrial [Lecanicillium sp. MT-2017a]